jgi:glycerol uptake facilitator-like aquaporin
MLFAFVIMGATDEWVPAGLAPIPIGLALTLIILASIPVTNTSVNPARSTWSRAVRRRMGARTTVAVLARADRGRRARRIALSRIDFGSRRSRRLA